MTFKARLDNALINTLWGQFCFVMRVDEVFSTSNFSNPVKQKNVMQLEKETEN